MKILDPGHKYELDNLDGEEKTILTFVKREGEKFPGNIGSYEGTNMQEVFRALIDRIQYLDNQIPDDRNKTILIGLRTSIYLLECRAAERHGRIHPHMPHEIETCKYCSKCGHIGCNGECKHE